MNRHGAEHASTATSGAVSSSYLRAHRDIRVVTLLSGVAANDVSLTRDAACSVFTEALATAGVTREAAGVAIRVSKTRIDQKCSAMFVSAPVTLADVMALIDAGGRPLDAAQVVVDALQSRIDAEREQTMLTVDSIGPLAMGIVAAMGSLCDGLGVALARRSVDDVKDLRRKCLAVQKQVAAVAALLGRIQ